MSPRKPQKPQPITLTEIDQETRRLGDLCAQYNRDKEPGKKGDLVLLNEIRNLQAWLVLARTQQQEATRDQ